jgi:putative SbcD/Mre11-related phosphoesterase
MEPRFVTGKPALLLGKTLVVSDLHIGIEHEYRQSGINLLSQTGRMLARLEELIGRTKADRLVVIGDVKHKVPGTSFQEEREIPAFFRRLSGRARVEIVPGNHDDNISRLVPPEVRVHPSEGALFGDAYLSHGHTWPSPDVLKAGAVIVGHTQPQVEIRDSLGYRWVEPVWVKASIPGEPLGKRYGHPTGAAGDGGERELIVLPAFNEFAGGMPVNRPSGKRFISPLLGLADMDRAGIYLLDGTYLGELASIRNMQPAQEPQEARPERRMHRRAGR